MGAGSAKPWPRTRKGIFIEHSLIPSPDSYVSATIDFTFNGFQGRCVKEESTDNNGLRTEGSSSVLSPNDPSGNNAYLYNFSDF